MTFCYLTVLQYCVLMKGSLGIKHKNKLEWMLVICVKCNTTFAENDSQGYKSVELVHLTSLLSPPPNMQCLPLTIATLQGSQQIGLGVRVTDALHCRVSVSTMLTLRWQKACMAQNQSASMQDNVNRFKSTYLHRHST